MCAVALVLGPPNHESTFLKLFRTQVALRARMGMLNAFKLLISVVIKISIYFLLFLGQITPEVVTSDGPIGRNDAPFMLH